MRTPVTPPSLLRSPRTALMLCLLLTALLPVAAQQARSVRPAKLQFNRDIRPILSENCFPCHGPDRNTLKANLRLDLRESAVQRGAIVPGRPEKSGLTARIQTKNPGLIMPPLASHKKLTPEQKSLLTRWIREGAPYQAHWAYIVPRRPALPVLRSASPPPVNPIDRFIFARLEQNGLKPSPLADRRTLIRRLSLDLIGLPPTPEEVAAFVADRAPNAYEKLVDRLLASPHYGERMAVPWLDVARYADTVGFHGDQNQNAWAYRDYVIASFNQNKPFDRFTREQIAGDLLPDAAPETRTATCFLRLNMMTREGGAQPKEYLAKYAADRVRTVGMAWLGSTLACAECHDHKYDPFTQKDFYSLAAFFADVKQWGVYADYGYTPNPDLRGYDNDSPFPPEIFVESRYLKERIERQRQRFAQTAAKTEPLLQTDPARESFSRWREQGEAFLAKHPQGWETPANPQVTVAGAKTPPGYRIEPDGSILFTERAPADATITLTPQTEWVAALRLELLPHAEHNGSLFRPGSEGGSLSLSATVQRADGRTENIAFRHAEANHYLPRYASSFEIIGVQGGWRLSPAHAKEPNIAVWFPAAPLRLQPGETLTVKLPALRAGCVRLSVSPFLLDHPAFPMRVEALAGALKTPDALTLQAYLLGTAWNADAFAQARERESDILECRKGISPVMVAVSTTPLTTRVLPRGNWQDESGPVVQPATPGFLPGIRPADGRRLTRLDLADWLVSPQNPLTARVFMNRLWRQFFGVGLSAQVEDLGAQGEVPSHPELLDWLAVEFRESGWNVKRMVRMIVLSHTYRQSSRLNPKLRDLDPSNRLLSSQNPRRLEAEFVRDNALAIAGLLNRDLGGPPCKPYQPPGYYANLQFPDRDYIASRDDRQWRRGVYMHWQRTFLHPMLANFDAPSREDCIAIRTAANTPQQALTLLNDPTFVEAARVFAARLLAEPGLDDARRLERAFQLALGRSVKPKERQSLLAFLEKIRPVYRERPEDVKRLLTVGYAPPPEGHDPVELAAWTNVCRVVLNLHETITRY